VSARPQVLAVLGPTASGKSALGLALARTFDGEILNCDSTAVYRGFDIGTDKVPAEAQQGIPHHLIDIADPTEVYDAAQYARDATAVIRQVHGRGRLPILVGGTGFYYRALVRGLFPGPGADQHLRDRLDRVAARRGPERLHRMLARVDPASAARIMPRDQKRLVRALEVFLTTGTPLTAHFAGTRGVPAHARPFGGLVYRQVMEMLRGVRDEPATRALIVQENRRYARRQLIWFRKEPTLIWFDGPGELRDTRHRVADLLAARGLEARGDAS
jgi:tRNA dimethylallyltransferase